MKINRFFTGLCLLAISLPTFAEKAGMDKCVAGTNLKNKYAFILNQTQNKNIVSVSRQVPNRAPVLIGTMRVSKVESLQPWQRQVASGGLLLVEGAAIVYGGVALAAGATGLSVMGSVAPGAMMTYGLGYVTPAIALQAVKPLNPVAQFERANVEKCLQKQVGDLSRGHSKSIILLMNDKDDYQDTLADINDLVLNDLRK